MNDNLEPCSFCKIPVENASHLSKQSTWYVPRVTVDEMFES